MANIKAKIHKPNKNTLEKAQQKHIDTQLCNCTNKWQCPLNGQCLTESIVYQASRQTIMVIKKNFTLVYPKNRFKVCYGIHKKLFPK